jgi:hypothetical protein
MSSISSLCRSIAESYQHWTGRALVDLCLSDEALAEALWDHEAVVVCHDTRPDPVFQYGNRKALELFEMDFEAFTQLPSRLSAELVHQTERRRVLNEVQTRGFSENYSGIRISSSGKRFRIQDAVIWNLLDAEGHVSGQAACFSSWTPIVPGAADQTE